MDDDEPQDEHARMMRARIELVLDLRAQGVQHRQILARIEQVDKAVFLSLDEDQQPPSAQALHNTTWPIACGQMLPDTLSVGLMLQALDPKPSHRVLLVGAGSGYTSVLLAPLVRRLTALERTRILTAQAADALRKASIPNADAVFADGHLGWPKAAPFDRILVMASGDHVPQPLIDQLAPDGVLVMPIGPADGPQRIMRFAYDADGLEPAIIGPTHFLALEQGLARAL